MVTLVSRHSAVNPSSCRPYSRERLRASPVGRLLAREPGMKVAQRAPSRAGRQRIFAAQRPSARTRNDAICALVTGASGQKSSVVQPLVMPAAATAPMPAACE